MKLYMKFNVLKKADFKITNWSGGDTTELYIYPEDSKYQNRDFLFRLSSATVNLEKSTFTKLDGVSRKLMLLSGEMELVHKDKYNKKLNPFEQDSFMGDWDTESYGKARDFNLMTRINCAGKLEHIKISSGLEFLLELKVMEKKTTIEALYNFGDPITMFIERQELFIDKEELLIIYLEEESLESVIKIVNNNDCDGNVVRATIGV